MVLFLQEDLVYRQPDDDSPSQSLWAASKNWLILDRLLAVQSLVLQEIEDGVNDLLKPAPPRFSSVQGLEKGKEMEYSPTSMESRLDTGSSNSGGGGGGGAEIDFYKKFSIQSPSKTLTRCRNVVRDDLITPTTHLLDMMYKSVAIRDARLSLGLNASLWRLSWITFIFLPLTFLSGFFGMNIDWLSNSPSAKWYSRTDSLTLYFPTDSSPSAGTSYPQLSW
ncbi:hypothetical protein B0H67DRAFT_102928 [Lasiosphaeris hirsuta]|uniref:Uncharacterized protein n=1 Tax=Lasiosphaeris hirsuta TaxID=260670 RepID=A0AA40AYG9_9PEZI|nr:hypothetical protein B0H67DRAFT_102928 [Lasiosphaeris hirsuta]